MAEDGKLTGVIKGAGQYTAGQLGPTIGPKRIAEEVFQGAPLLTGLANITGKAGMSVASSPFKAMGAVGSALMGWGESKPATEGGLDDVKDAVKQQTKDQKDEYKKQDEHRTLLQKIFRTRLASPKKENRFAKEEERREAEQLSLFPSKDDPIIKEGAKDTVGGIFGGILGAMTSAAAMAVPAMSALLGPALVPILLTAAGLAITNRLQSMNPFGEGGGEFDPKPGDPDGDSGDEHLASGALRATGYTSKKVQLKALDLQRGTFKGFLARKLFAGAPRLGWRGLMPLDFDPAGSGISLKMQKGIDKRVATAMNEAIDAEVRALGEVTDAEIEKALDPKNIEKPQLSPDEIKEQRLKVAQDKAAADLNRRAPKTKNVLGKIAGAAKTLKFVSNAAGPLLEVGMAAMDIEQARGEMTGEGGTRPASISQEQFERIRKVEIAEATGAIVGGAAGTGLGMWAGGLPAFLLGPGGAMGGAWLGRTWAEWQLDAEDVKKLNPQQQREYEVWLLGQLALELENEKDALKESTERFKRTTVRGTQKVGMATAIERQKGKINKIHEQIQMLETKLNQPIRPEPIKRLPSRPEKTPTIISRDPYQGSRASMTVPPLDRPISSTGDQTLLLSAIAEIGSSMASAAADLKAASVNMADRSITVNGPGALAQGPPGPRKNYVEIA